MFEDATFHSRGILSDKTPTWMLLALAVNLSLISALILQPLIYPDGIPARFLPHVLYAPTELKHPIAQTAQPRKQQPVTTTSFHNPFQAPQIIPRSTSNTSDETPPAEMTGFVSISDAVAGGTDVQTSVFAHNSPPAVVKAPASKPIAISEGVGLGMLVSRTTPVYPPIAKLMGISGTVVLIATISKQGTIENLRAISGPPQLRQAAADAVKTWRYRPYLLNHEPVDVETTVNIQFTIGSH